MPEQQVKIVDCTLRDGGYYTAWDFAPDLVTAYFEAMVALKVDYVEVGLRSPVNKGFKGGFAFSTDDFLNSLAIPVELENKIGVMINASELPNEPQALFSTVEKLFTPKKHSLVTLVRIACHANEFEAILPVAGWLKQKGYVVGINLMQIADRSDQEIAKLARLATHYPIDVLYFADSMGCLSPAEVDHITHIFRQ